MSRTCRRVIATTGCGEPNVVIEGMDWSALGVEPLRGTYHAKATLVGVFDGSHFVLTEPPGPIRHIEPVVNALDFSSECEPPSGGWAVQDSSLASTEAMDKATAYAQTQAEFAGLWIDRSNGAPGSNDPHDAVLNFRFTGALREHEASLREIWGGALCVVPGSHTRQDLEAIERTIRSEIEVANSIIHPKLDAVLVQVVIPTPGYSQLELNERFGEGTVIITSSFRPVES